MIYLTFGEGYSGVFQGQVLDLCKFIGEKFDEDIRLISFVSIRNFFEEREQIKKKVPTSFVLPMVPKAQNWKYNLPLLVLVLLFLRTQKIIARNELATNLALLLNKIGLSYKIGYDGRGAVAAEQEEYLKSSSLNKVFLERNAVIKSDIRIAVSQKLVDYWREKYAYRGEDHVVIPCTVSRSFLKGLPKKNKIIKIRNEFGFGIDDIILVYSGSLAGWQSVDLITDKVEKFCESAENIRILFLSKKHQKIDQLLKKYPNQVRRIWVKPEDVSNYLSSCDYGLLIRESSITNNVASPTKFAEYLISGLSVIISENLGDYTEFIQTHNCGYIFKKDEKISKYLKKLDDDDKIKNRKLAEKYFLKDSPENLENYKYLINELNSY